MTSSGSDRRRDPRVALVETLDAGGSSGEEYVIEVVDLSASGARFRCETPIPIDTAIRMNINFYPVDFPIRALVVWHRASNDGRFEHGAEFVNLPPEEAYLIRDYVRSAMKQQP